MDLSDQRIRRDIGKKCACFNMRRAARLVTQRFDRAFRGTDITANQFSILMAAYDQKEILLTKLAKTLGIERTTLSRNLSLLERKEMVSIVMGADKRERRIAITKKGIASLERTFPFWLRAQNEVEDLVGSEKWKGLLTGLHKVAKSL